MGTPRNRVRLGGQAVLMACGSRPCSRAMPIALQLLRNTVQLESGSSKERAFVAWQIAVLVAIGLAVSQQLAIRAKRAVAIQMVVQVSRRKDTYRAVWQYNISYTNRHTRFAVGPGTTTGEAARAQTADTARWLPLLILEIARACALNLPQARSPRRVSQARQGPAAVSHADHGSLHKHIAVRLLAPSAHVPENGHAARVRCRCAPA